MESIYIFTNFEQKTASNAYRLARSHTLTDIYFYQNNLQSSLNAHLIDSFIPNNCCFGLFQIKSKVVINITVINGRVEPSKNIRSKTEKVSVHHIFRYLIISTQTIKHCSSKLKLERRNFEQSSAALFKKPMRRLTTWQHLMYRRARRTKFYSCKSPVSDRSRCARTTD